MILSFILILFFTIGAISASDLNDFGPETQDVENLAVEEIGEELALEEDNSLEDASQLLTGENDSEDINTSLTSADTTLVNGQYFSVTLKDGNGDGIENKTIRITLNGVSSNVKTNPDGVAKVKINLNAGTYDVSYSFAKDGEYSQSSGKTTIFVVSSSVSNIQASDYVAYVGIRNKYTVTLKAGTTPLPNRTVKFLVRGKIFTRVTDANGQASIFIALEKGAYTFRYTYAGEKNIKGTTGTVLITVKQGAPTVISKANSVVYYSGVLGVFKIKLTDAKGNPVKNAKIVYKISGKSYVRKTNAEGISTSYIKKAAGTYNLQVSFAKTSIYNAASKTFTIKVRAQPVKNTGMWLFGYDMKSVNLKTLKTYGFKHIFLNYYAIDLYGKNEVESWIKSANTYGIKVHIWMQVFYNGNWLNPVKNGNIDYNLINSRVNMAKTYAKIKGVSGIHFDYLRYPGTAYKYTNSVNAVNAFVKQATTAIHAINKNLIVSAAVMPEPSSMKYYYGQDIATMGKYLDAIVPMVYKGNYNAGASWIKSVTQTFAKQSTKAEIWAGLQSYRSDSNINKLPASELKNDAVAAVSGGATGVILFRFGLFNFVNLSLI